MHTYEKILEALGEASMCWSETPQGVFDSTKGIEIAKKLYEEILKEKSGNLPEANRNAVLADVLALTHEEIVSIACEYNIKGYGIGIEFYDGYRVGFVSGIKYIIDRLKGQVC